jgi:hypothetical protein
MRPYTTFEQVSTLLYVADVVVFVIIIIIIIVVFAVVFAVPDVVSVSVVATLSA